MDMKVPIQICTNCKTFSGSGSHRLWMSKKYYYDYYELLTIINNADTGRDSYDR